MTVTTGTGRRPGVGRPLALLVGSGLALAGLVTAVVLWLGVAVGTFGDDGAGQEPCVAAAAAGTADATVSYHALPTRSACTWTVDGRSETVELAHAPTAVSWAAASAVVVGLGVLGSTVVAGRLGRVRRSAPR